MASTRAEASCAERMPGGCLGSIRNYSELGGACREAALSPSIGCPRTNFDGDGAGAGGVGEWWRKSGSRTSPMIRPTIALK
jgi:hypothetical protein